MEDEGAAEVESGLLAVASLDALRRCRKDGGEDGLPGLVGDGRAGDNGVPSVLIAQSTNGV
jgi:hypothetical protein